MVDQAEIHKRVQSNDVEERKRAVKEIKINFAILNDKEKAWNELIRLTQDNNYDVRLYAACSLGSCYSKIPEEHKKQSWDDLIRLTQGNNNSVRISVARSLGSCYSHISENFKKQAWDDLHRLTQDENTKDVRLYAARSLGICFSHISEEFKKQAWDDLIRLTQDENTEDVRCGATDALGSCYFHIPEEYKKQSWDDLIRLTQDNNDSVRWNAARSLGSCYSHIPEKFKKQAWDDLHRITHDKNNSVRRNAARSLGSCYSHIPEVYRKQARDDLQRLSQNKNTEVRIAANHSSGRVSIYRASQAKGDESVRKELETALRFFEKASDESTYFNPAKFCLPFYRSFYTITFRKEDAEVDVKKYLAEAKRALEGSTSKKNLLEVVENLGNALKEVQKTRDLTDMKCDLNAYRLYCEHAADMLDETEGEAPAATLLMRKGLPIIDEKIKGIIKEIQEKAKALCKKTKETSLEPLGIETNEKAKQLSELDYLPTELILNIVFC